ncbi:UDP-2,3-diacylglucosamine diphosphatase [Agaribacter flavus]|uniref:UDP-2,3-diacylglucosamine diphosphatase n=1 Tax=Agaribacter flavus TaxID=1902781 RepID=A0ABV7FSC1_9ALTE
MQKQQHFSSVFISDIHLGNQDCKAEFLLDFLNNISCDKLFLVGDIVDLWQMTKQFRWPAAHNDVLHKIMALSHGNTQVIYLPGNHDEPLQKYQGLQFGDVKICREYIHTANDNKKYLVFHGDQCDGDVTLGKFQAWIGDKGYDLLLFLNRHYNRYKAWRDGSYWSLAGYIKSRIKGANKAIYRYKLAACKRAKAKGLDGVICGHIHHPEQDEVLGVSYINDGDWVENCSALVENMDGSMEILHWTGLNQAQTLKFPIKKAKKAA